MLFFGWSNNVTKRKPILLLPEQLYLLKTVVPIRMIIIKKKSSSFETER